ncbi:hypothetical protein KAS08_02270 [Candidatus Pacearchaeota archaeon]|nr:hypothetical protein [Candidatus Pacearchaeota archaeon]
MTIDNFLDTNIVVNYVNRNNTSKKIVKDCYDYVESIKGKIILCGFVANELEKLFEKRSRIHNAVLKKVKDKNYDLSENLNRRESPRAKKLYVKVKDIEIKKLSELLAKERVSFEMGVEKFLKIEVDKIIINPREINQELVRKINDIISNIDDCKVLASALQYQSKEEHLFNFVTADDDFSENGYEYLKEHFKINHSKDEIRFPKLVNLLTH